MTITVENVILQFDVPDSNDPEQVKRAITEGIELINLTLQREPYGLAAQIALADESLTYVSEVDDDEEDDDDLDEEDDDDDLDEEDDTDTDKNPGAKS